MLRQAARMEPGRFTIWLDLAVCYEHLDRHADTAACYGTCIALAPERAECFYNRALAGAALGNTDQALRDYDRALQLDPVLAVAVLNRGILRYRQGSVAEPCADLEREIERIRPVLAAYAAS